MWYSYIYPFQYIIGNFTTNRQLIWVDGGEGGNEETDIEATIHSERSSQLDLSLVQDVNLSPKASKMKNFPQMLLSDSKLKRSKLMTRRESQALLEGVRKNRGLQSTQSCNN